MTHSCGAAIAAATILLATPAAAERQAVPVEAFLASIGVNTSLQNRGQPFERTVEMLRFAGVRWVRGGTEGLTEHGPVTLDTWIELHRKAGVQISWGPLSGSDDPAHVVSTGRRLAAAGALLAFEGPNEPNNWEVSYSGAKGGGKTASWKAVAEYQAALYRAVKGDPPLRRHPVWSISEAGAETDDVGLQYLEVPPGASSSMPAGTRFADAANLHDYPTGAVRSPLPDNVAWDAASPGEDVQADGLAWNNGRTWARHYQGYDAEDLARLPRVATETGVWIQKDVDEAKQGALILDIYLSQFARGFSHTALYLLRDRTDEAGNQTFGLFRPDYAPRKAALWLHNLVEILTSPDPGNGPRSLDYAIEGAMPTVHDILLRGRSGRALLVVWDERGSGSDHVTIRYDRPRNVSIHDPTIGTQAIRADVHGDSVEIDLTNHPVVLEISN